MGALILFSIMNYCQAEEAVKVWQRSWFGFLSARSACHYWRVVATGFIVLVAVLVLVPVIV